MLLIDTKEQILVKDEEIKLTIARKRPLEQWLKEMFTLQDLRNAHEGSFIDGPVVRRPIVLDERTNHAQLTGRAKVLEDRRLALFAYTTETLNLLILPMVKTE